MSKVPPISSRDENDSLCSTEDVSQLSTSTSRGAFRQQYVCERDSVFSASSGMDPCDALIQRKAGFPCSGLNAGSSFISQDEGMSESPVETLKKAIVLHLFWTGRLTFL